MKGLVITAENKMQVREFGEPAYETIGKAVGGWIEVVHPKGLPGPFCMVVNEEGLLRGLPLICSAAFSMIPCATEIPLSETS